MRVMMHIYNMIHSCFMILIRINVLNYIKFFGNYTFSQYKDILCKQCVLPTICSSNVLSHKYVLKRRGKIRYITSDSISPRRHSQSIMSTIHVQPYRISFLHLHISLLLEAFVRHNRGRIKNRKNYQQFTIPLEHLFLEQQGHEMWRYSFAALRNSVEITNLNRILSQWPSYTIIRIGTWIIYIVVHIVIHYAVCNIIYLIYKLIKYINWNSVLYN